MPEGIGHVAEDMDLLIDYLLMPERYIPREPSRRALVEHAHQQATLRGFTDDDREAYVQRTIARGFRRYDASQKRATRIHRFGMERDEVAYTLRGHLLAANNQVACEECRSAYSVGLARVAERLLREEPENCQGLDICDVIEYVNKDVLNI